MRSIEDTMNRDECFIIYTDSFTSQLSYVGVLVCEWLLVVINDPNEVRREEERRASVESDGRRSRRKQETRECNAVVH